MTSRWLSGSGSNGVAYAVAAGIAAAATAVRAFLGEVAGLERGDVPFISFFPAVLLAAWYGGLGPGVLTLALTTVSAFLWFVLPGSAEMPITVVAFLLSSGCVLAIAEAFHRARRRADLDRERLLAAERDREHLLEAERAARAAAEAGARARDTFLATMSHELRTPLSPILAWGRMLAEGKLDEAQRGQAIETILRCARAQAQLVDDLLDVARIVAGKLRLDVRTVSVARVIDAALAVVRPAADAKEIRLQTTLDSAVLPVAGDPERLQQVVWNLLSNAIKFTPKHGSVHVVLERVNSHVEIVVRDSGPGIASDFLPHVFDRFAQAESGSTRSHGGLGLGLSISRHLVEAHGGTIHAENAQGGGSVFTVKLPVMALRSAGERERRHPGDPKPEVPSAYPSLDGCRILVVDDEPDSNEVVRTLLVSCGAEVRVAGSADEALEVLSEWTPDLLVSDVGMPGKDGYALIAAVRARSDTSLRLPAIALTAYASVEDRIRLLSAGYQAHVAKPLELGELVAVLASLYRGAREARS